MGAFASLLAASARIPLPRRHIFSPLLVDREVIRDYSRALLGGAALMLIPSLARIFATNAGEGALSIFNYALRLIEFPLGMSALVLVAFVYPRLADACKKFRTI